MYGSQTVFVRKPSVVGAITWSAFISESDS